MNNIEPVEKVNGIARNRKVGYHHNEDDPRGFLEMFKRKVEQAEKEQLEEQLVEKPQKATPSEIILIKRKILRYRTSNLHIYRMETEKTKYDRELKTDNQSKSINSQVNIGKMMNAYNKSAKNTEKAKEQDKTEKLNESNAIPKTEEEKKETVKSKKEEMKEFKQRLESLEKTGLDDACEEFERKKREINRKKRMYANIGKNKINEDNIR